MAQAKTATPSEELELVLPHAPVADLPGPFLLLYTDPDQKVQELGKPDSWDDAVEQANAIVERGHLTGKLEIVPAAALDDTSEVGAVTAKPSTLEHEPEVEVEPRRVLEEPGEEPVTQDGQSETSDSPPSDEEPKQEEPIVEPGGQQTLIDKSQFETEALALPKIDGEGVDKIQAKFGGGVWLARSEAADVALIRDRKLGSTVTLMVECEVGPPVPGYTTNRDGDLDALVLSRTFKVTSVYVPAAEEL